MKLCFLTATFHPTVGGAELILDRLGTSLRDRGHGVTVIAPIVRGKNNRIERPYRIVRYQRPSSKRFGVRQTLVHLFYAKMAYGCDVLHCHGAYPPGYVGASFKVLTGCPLVIRPHGSDILEGEWIRKHRRLDRRMRKSLAKADAVVAQSQDFASLIATCGVSAERIVRIPNGIPLSEAAPSSETRPEVPYILAMGSLMAKKGFDVLIEAFARVSPQWPGVHLWLAGDGVERPRYEARIKACTMEHRVRLLGQVSGSTKDRLLSECLFFVTPSRREPFANVNLEAMAAGKAILASAVGGNREVVQHGVNGLLVESENPQALADGIIMLLRAPEHTRQMGEASQRVVRDYDWDTTVDRYENLYESVMRSHAPAGSR
jgi:glycosyltransferase involved in cell wall biosynthesis